MSDLMGWAAVIVALTAALVAVFGQFNTRAAIKDAAAEAARVARENKAAIAAQTETLAEVAGNVDGNLSRLQVAADKFAAEVLRVAREGTPTPVGEPSAAQPVTLTAGKPTVVSDRTTSKEEP